MDPLANVVVERNGAEARLRFIGRWTSEQAAAVEEEAGKLASEAEGAQRVLLDLSAVERLDTLGAWVLDRARASFEAGGQQAGFVGLDEPKRILLQEVAYHDFGQKTVARGSAVVDILSDVGSTVCGAGRDVVGGVSFLGSLVAAMGRMIVHPARFRITSVVFHLEAVGFRSVPIITLISFLVGCIVAQQGIFQLSKFGATPFVVDLTGILTLRELGVLLTSIMIAGRSGSAFTAEIGSMKMREEIDALRVMGLDPIEVLVVPRILALMLALPLLTFLANIAGLFGGGVVAWLYGNISQEVFLGRLRSAIAFNTFMVGIIKAPFMALVIGIIACIEGLAVKGSAESLGRQVTSSVVKSIFMVIVVDGLFAMFFASIKY
ncbi:ABC transporter permease [Alsobacter metallidurans]|uniref:ABC transporter permease n=1 Tax=Alsobacter metallidurans TaxID=340221 RepID=A0A917I923_9HYPH|nr:ABC transporter permease [Alsobacter metallidurans]GGH26683.1 ABC transporter permease [Alsobacter metallidurans]